ncbi:Membrane protein involved in the export of O-antigen and teichoic acid [Epibacterium ulvae]|uniref:Membrane protein involved in the export of O-antigen and teichoic acid n=1 Tax=Epibacterium ulvae TaxID=1156985 RepID=A0A1G5PML3_9RHOB|nr:oligosaccharide flippase family protein [Epibacterium ulvae]SCZ50722.1 Membrane protein involved in the export of O-antigen and teichoic acid [Epibacterium ulvae]
MVDLVARFRGAGLMARALRSASWLLLGYGGSQALRLASNLILTRLLFPEAFGLMALVSVITVGLALFSDIGLGPAIAQNKRGDEPDFLDTAWTIQVIRGGALWGFTFLLAWPVAEFYDAPDLLFYLPVAGIALAISGFLPTRVHTAHRHLLAGRVTVIELISQFLGLLGMVALAVLTQSVFALVIGSVLQAAFHVGLAHRYLPGHRNQFHWSPDAAKELIKFGKWIFLSTAFWFITSQGDRAILGKFISLETLGIYNIAFFLASFPMALGYAVNARLMIPIYRDKPVHHDVNNRRKQRLLRTGLSAGLLSLIFFLSFCGPWLVSLLYDARYEMAGPIVVILALCTTPAVIVMTYDQAALAAGDSRLFFILNATRAIAQTMLFLVGVLWLGLPGGILALGAAMIFAYPVIVYLARKHNVWDPVHDACFLLLSALVALIVLRLHWDSVTLLFIEMKP